MNDPLDILVTSYASIYLQAGVCGIEAWMRAEDDVARLLEALAPHGAPIVAFLRRVKVYRLKSRGVAATDIAHRLGIAPRTAHKDYKAELMRRRKVANAA